MKIRIDGLIKKYDSTIALEKISLEIPAGQIVSVLGPNGAGKTTLLRCLTGISAPDEGAVYYDGEKFGRDRLDQRKRFFIMPDFPFFYSEMTVIEHIGMVLRLYDADGAGVEDSVLELLKEFHLLTLAEARLGSLSRGETYKAALIALLAADPEVWILDEPFASGMDPQGISAFKKRCRDAVKRGRTILYTTQILEVAESFSDSVCILSEGKLHAFDTIPNLRQTINAKSESVLETIFQLLHEDTTC